MQELLDSLDLRPFVDPFALDIVTEQVAEEMRRNRKRDSAIETLLYLREQGIPFKAVLALAKKMGDNPPLSKSRGYRLNS